MPPSFAPPWNVRASRGYVFGDTGCPIPPGDGPFLAESTELAIKTIATLQTMSQTMSQADFCGVNTRISEQVHFWGGVDAKPGTNDLFWWRIKLSDGVSNYRGLIEVCKNAGECVFKINTTYQLFVESWSKRWAGRINVRWRFADQAFAHIGPY